MESCSAHRTHFRSPGALMTSRTAPPPSIRVSAGGALARDVLLTPDRPEWDQARTAWNLTRGPAIRRRSAMPANDEDVVALVRFARAERSASRAPGDRPPGVLRSVRWTARCCSRPRCMRNRARRCAGAAPRGPRRAPLWQDVVALAEDHGLAPLAGSAPDVGVVGYTLGGGLSWLSRRFGLAVNSVLAAEVVTADGAVLTVDADNEPDLFWALRGGGGSYAIVTALEFELHPVTAVYGGALLWPMHRAEEVLIAWQLWLAQAPDEVTSVARLLRIPELPDVPPPLRGRQMVAVEAAFIGDGGCGREAARAVARAGAGARDVRDADAAAARRPAHGPAQPGAGARRRDAAGPSSRRRRSTTCSTSPGLMCARRCCASTCATSVAAIARRARRWWRGIRRSTPSSPCSRSGWRRPASSARSSPRHVDAVRDALSGPGTPAGRSPTSPNGARAADELYGEPASRAPDAQSSAPMTPTT